MALSVNNYSTVFGVPATHWVVDSINLNEKYQYAEITMFGYYSEEAYLNGVTPLETKKVKVNWNDGFQRMFSKKTLSNQNLYGVAYDYIKSNVEMFKDATDV